MLLGEMVVLGMGWVMVLEICTSVVLFLYFDACVMLPSTVRLSDSRIFCCLTGISVAPMQNGGVLSKMRFSCKIVDFI